ncbi:MAG: transcription termination/antitermination protein NusA [Clostridiales bacterium]|jgi:N utilization substance protein A|nr:transcription termination/antitermination protein NusA [Clostridiales bacterium]
MKARAKEQKKENAAGVEIFTALDLLEKEKGIPKSYMLEKIAQALTTAYKRDSDGVSENCVIDADEKKKELKLYAVKTVVEEVKVPATEITLEEARKIDGSCDYGDDVRVEVKTMDFGRIAAQTAKQVIIQGIREAEAGILYQRFTGSEREILSAVVSRVEPSGNVLLELDARRMGGERTEAILPVGEQARGEVLREGERIRVFVVEVKVIKNRPRLLISRSHPELVKRLFEMNVPELRDGLVEIKSVSREAGSRTKMAVSATQSDIDPIGACVGPRGERVNAVVDELRGEKIDIVRYSDDPAAYVAAALSPASVLRVDVADDGKSCRVIVPDDQLSLAIGKEGQNARLAVKLTGVKIDIKSRTQEEVLQKTEWETAEETLEELPENAADTQEDQ